MRTKTLVTISTLLMLAVWLGPPAAAATQSTVVSGLRLPVKVILTPERNLLVAEAGNPAPNTGRISLVDQAGNRSTLIDALPSGPAPDNVQGPAGIVLSTPKILYIALGTGDTTAGFPGGEFVNPLGPSSPIFSSVLRVQFDKGIDDLGGEFTMTLADQHTLAYGFPVTLENGVGERAAVSLVTDFRDVIRDPDSGEPVRSNPFGLVVWGSRAYVADASRNTIEEVDLASGRATRLVELAPVPNPLPFGPPFLEPVPTGLSREGNDLLVALETGFPFPFGAAEIRRIDPRTGEVTPLFTGVTQTLDILPVHFPGGGTGFYVVELSVDLLSGAPGRVLLFTSPTAVPTIISDTLLFPSSIARDDVTGDLYVTESLVGDVVRISP